MIEETLQEEATMDDIWQAGVDADKVNDTARKLLLARGPYITTPPLTVSGMAFPAKGDIPARTIFRAYGMVEWVGKDAPVHKAEDGTVTGAASQGRVSFSFSPTERFYPNDDGSQNPDEATKLWVLLVKAYTMAYGYAPKTAGDIKAYLEAYPVRLTIGIKGKDDPRNAVFHVSAVKA